MAIDFKALHEARLQRNPPQLRTCQLSPLLEIHYYEHPGLEIGSVLWEGGKALGEFLLQRDEIIAGKRVVELGSGLGIAGLVAARTASVVHLTDKPELIPLLQRNIDVNHCFNASVFPYLWGTDPSAQLQPPYDVLLGADLLYIEASYEALKASFKALTGPNSLLVLTWKHRGLGEARFISSLQADYTEVETASLGLVSLSVLQVS